MAFRQVYTKLLKERNKLADSLLFRLISARRHREASNDLFVLGLMDLTTEAWGETGDRILVSINPVAYWTGRGSVPYRLLWTLTRMLHSRYLAPDPALSICAKSDDVVRNLYMVFVMYPVAQYYSVTLPLFSISRS